MLRVQPPYCNTIATASICRGYGLGTSIVLRLRSLSAGTRCTGQLPETHRECSNSCSVRNLRQPVGRRWDACSGESYEQPAGSTTGEPILSLYLGEPDPLELENTADRVACWSQDSMTEICMWPIYPCVIHVPYAYAPCIWPMHATYTWIEPILYVRLTRAVEFSRTSAASMVGHVHRGRERRASGADAPGSDPEDAVDILVRKLGKYLLKL